MPIPKPIGDEDKDAFMERCMSAMSGEMDHDQAAAVCMKQWDNRNGSPAVERRCFAVQELRADKEGDKRVIRGHAAVFNSLSEELGFFGPKFREKIAPGAFADTIKTDDVRALWNHDANFILGRNKAGTLRMTEDADGLAVEIDPPDAEFARGLVASIERRDVTGMSIGFTTLGESWERGKDKEPDIRTLTKVQLFDVSPVTYPAYQQTDVAVAQRSHDAFLKANLIKRITEQGFLGYPLSLAKARLSLVK